MVNATNLLVRSQPVQIFSSVVVAVVLQATNYFAHDNQRREGIRLDLTQQQHCYITAGYFLLALLTTL